jgi:hypothetical protein
LCGQWTHSLYQRNHLALLFRPERRDSRRSAVSRGAVTGARWVAAKSTRRQPGSADPAQRTNASPGRCSASPAGKTICTVQRT